MEWTENFLKKLAEARCEQLTYDVDVTKETIRFEKKLSNELKEEYNKMEEIKAFAEQERETEIYIMGLKDAVKLLKYLEK